jgi:magnesium transporter
MNKEYDIIEIIQNIIRTSTPENLRENLQDFHPYELASAFVTLTDEEKNLVLAVLSNEELADIISYLDEDDSKELIEEHTSEQIAPIINEMEPDDAYDILTNIEADKAKDIFELLDEDSQKTIEILKEYEEGTAGSIMNTNFISIESGKDIKDLMRVLIKNAPDAESINTCFVVDAEGKLLGTLDLKKIIMTKSPKIVDEIMNENYNSVSTQDRIDYVINQISAYDIYDMPVIEDGILKGIITMDDALEAVASGAEEDYAKLAGLSDIDVMDESLGQSVRKRLPILAILLILNIGVSIIISAFDYLFTYPSLTVITIFQPLILGLAGNSGIQSLGVTIRKIASSELDRSKQVWRHLLKEATVGILNGIIVGTLVFAFSTIFLYVNKNPLYLPIGRVVGIAVALGLIIANLFGAMIPVLLYKLKFDPAAASGPFITTFMDILTALIYFTLSSLIVYHYLT